MAYDEDKRSLGYDTTFWLLMFGPEWGNLRSRRNYLVAEAQKFERSLDPHTQTHP